jgi:hypothetical protein
MPPMKCTDAARKVDGIGWQKTNGNQSRFDASPLVPGTMGAFCTLASSPPQVLQVGDSLWLRSAWLGTRLRQSTGGTELDGTTEVGVGSAWTAESSLEPRSGPDDAVDCTDPPCVASSGVDRSGEW